MAEKLYYVIYPSSLSAPTDAQIAAGKDSTGSAAVASGNEASPVVDGAFTFTSAATGLSANTAYKASVVWYDGTSYSNVVTTAEWYTTAVVAGSGVQQANKTTQAAVSQEHITTGHNVNQANKTTQGVSGQTHETAGSNVTQANKTTQGAASSGSLPIGDNVQQANKTTVGAIAQTHETLGGNVNQANKTTQGAAVATQTATGNNVQQANKTTAGAAISTHNTAGQNVKQVNKTTQAAASKFPNAVNFGSSNSSRYYKLAANDAFVPSGDFSWLALVKIEAGSTKSIETIVSNGTRGDAGSSVLGSFKSIGDIQRPFFQISNTTDSAASDDARGQWVLISGGRYSTDKYSVRAYYLTDAVVKSGPERTDSSSISKQDIYFGSRPDGSSAHFFEGAISWIAYLDTNLSETDLSNIGTGVTKILTDWEPHLIEFWPFETKDNATITGLINGYTLTQYGSGYGPDVQAPLEYGQLSPKGDNVSQANKTAVGAAVQTHQTAGNNVNQANKTTQGAAGTNAVVLGDNVIQINKTTAGVVAQTHKPLGNNVIQLNRTTQGAAATSHNVQGDNVRQLNRTTQAPVGQVTVTAGDNVIQINKTTESGLPINGDNVIQVNKTTSGGITQIAAPKGDNVIQINRTTADEIIIGRVPYVIIDNVIMHSSKYLDGIIMRRR